MLSLVQTGYGGPKRETGWDVAGRGGCGACVVADELPMHRRRCGGDLRVDPVPGLLDRGPGLVQSAPPMMLSVAKHGGIR
jgi:hypothetical protein